MRRLRTEEGPGPPPAGVHLERADGETRIWIGGGRSSGIVALLVGLVLGAWRLCGGRRPYEGGAICLNGERIWIERPELARPRWMEEARTALVDAVGPEARAESLPLESMPRSVVEQVRVDSCPGPESQPRLLIEAEAGRLEYIGAQLDQKKLEWVRDYLRYRLAAGV